MERAQHESKTQALREAEKAFRARLAELGLTEVLEVEWAADHSTQAHTHEFRAFGLVTRGSFTLTTPAGPRRIEAGETFELAPGTDHTERVNGVSTTLLAARLYPPG